MDRCGAFAADAPKVRQAPRANKGLKIMGSPALLLHAEFDGLHRVGRADGVVPVLVGLGPTGFGLKNRLELCEGSAQIVVVTDGFNVH